MKATTIINALAVSKDALSSLEAGQIFSLEYQFALQSAKESFNRGVIPAIALAAPTRSHAVLCKQQLEISAGVLCASRGLNEKGLLKAVCVFVPPL